MRTPAELAAREKNRAGGFQRRRADRRGGNSHCWRRLKARARELGSATSFANQLQARQEMTDSLRDKLLRDPSSELVTEAQLKLLLYTNPRN